MTLIYSKSGTIRFRKDLRQNMTKSETVLWKHIKGNQLGYKFRRQHGIGKYIVDFYCAPLKFAIEIDGSTHDEESVFEKDVIKQSYLESLGIYVRRYSAQQVFKTINEVIGDLYQTCDELAKARGLCDPLAWRTPQSRASVTAPLAKGSTDVTAPQ